MIVYYESPLRESTIGVFPPAAALRPSTTRSGSLGAVGRSSVTAGVSTADSTLMLGRRLSRMATAAAATKAS